MFAYDMPLDQLQTLTLPQNKAPDFDAFWKSALMRSEEQPLAPQSELLEYPIPDLRIERVSFAAYDGGRIVGWALSPKSVARRPTLIFWHGYGGDRGKVFDYLPWALQGLTVLSFDVRGQLGESSDAAEYPGGRTGGWISQGLLDPARYFLTRAYIDTTRALDYAGTRDDVDSERIGVTGCSQGGGLSLAAAALDRRPVLCVADIPGFCHFRRTLTLTRVPPWTDLTVYFQRRPQDVEQGMRTLSYVEINNLADRITCPTLISSGLIDELCPPSTVYAAFNRIPAQEKRIVPFAFSGHEGGLIRDEMVGWVRRHLFA